MKNFILLFIVNILLYSFSSAQTTIPAGNISGTWTLAGSPYLIQGTIQIPNDSTLTIEPGISVNFQDTFKLKIQGRLLAIGTIADTITFSATDTTNGWRGIRFYYTPATNDTSKFFYCKLQYGKATGVNPDNKGGAFYFYYFSKAIISNSCVSNCTANYRGAGIYVYNSSPIISNNTISNNSASNYGGGISCWYSSPIIMNNTFSNNSAVEGGGIHCNNNSPTISNNTISNNSASWGGGISCYISHPTIANNTISNNSAFYGGGIYCDSSSSTITNNTISNNSSDSYGGGISCWNSSPTIMNNTISNNSASTEGGGIDCYSGSNPTITNNTISNNWATKGGGISCYYSSPTLYNTILWGNTADTSGAQVLLFTEDSDPNFYYCDVEGGITAFGLNGAISYTGSYQNNLDADPLFVAPDTTITADWSLLAGSSCIDAGTPDTTGLNLLATDLAGNPRICDGRIDIGAYESLITSVNETNILSIKIFPIPTTDKITIITSNKSTIEILNINGQIIKSIISNNKSTSIDLIDLSSGVYIARVITDKEIVTKKFIKE